MELGDCGCMEEGRPGDGGFPCPQPAPLLSRMLRSHAATDKTDDNPAPCPWQSY